MQPAQAWLGHRAHACTAACSLYTSRCAANISRAWRFRSECSTSACARIWMSCVAMRIQSIQIVTDAQTSGVGAA